MSESQSILSQLTARVISAESKVAAITSELISIKKCIALFQRSNSTRNLSTSSKRPRESNTDEDASSGKKLLKTDSSKFDGSKYTMDENNFVIVYTDGACENNGRSNAKAGLGVWFGPNHILNVSEPVEGRATNNVGEIQACVKAVELAKENGIKKLNIHTDSQFVINSMTKWLPNWKRRGWKLAGGGTVKNKDDFEKLDAASKDMQVKYTYVAGHKGIIGNEQADELARHGAECYGK